MKVSFLLIAIFITQTCIAQIVTIPDSIFKTYLLSVSGLDANGDGEIQIDEAEQPGIFQLNVRNLGIGDLTGIETFKNLRLFNCSENPIESVDFSENNELTSLNTSNCPIETLDLSALVNLTSLNAQSCNLSEIDLSNNADLVVLTITSNTISELDVSNNPELTTLRAGNNLISDIDLTLNEAIEKIDLSINSLEQIDLSNQDKVSELIIHTNLISSLDLSNMYDLINLSCQGNTLNLLNFENSDSLQIISASRNELAELDLSNKTKLLRVSCTDNFISEIDLSASKELEWLKIDNNLIENIDVSNNSKLVLFESFPNLFSVLDLTAIDSLTSFAAGGPNLRFINLANGANEDLGFMMASGDNLDCIQLDQGFDFTDLGVLWFKPAHTIYTYECCLASESTILDTICAGIMYLSPSGNQIITESGTYQDTIKNSFTCDSILTLIIDFDEIDLQLEVTDTTIAAQDTSASSYQWIDCNTMEDIEGANSYFFAPSDPGNYAVQIIRSNCIDTSACIVMNIISSNFDSIEESIVNLYPNPTTGQLNLKLDSKYTDISIQIMDLSGKVVNSVYIENRALLTLDLPRAKGVYIIRIISQEKLLGMRKVLNL